MCSYCSLFASIQTLFLVADQCLKRNGGFDFDGHLLVLNEVVFDQLHSILQHYFVVETQQAEGVQQPAGLKKTKTKGKRQRWRVPFFFFFKQLKKSTGRKAGQHTLARR